MNFKSGKLYSLSNVLWETNIYKIGNTGQTIKKRISSLQTSLYIDCCLVYLTDQLICCKYYEYLLKNILNKYRINKKREFYNIDQHEIKLIFDFFNQMNTALNTQKKLYNYIKTNNPEYFNKKRNRSTESSSSSDKPKRKKISLFVDTSY